VLWELNVGSIVFSSPCASVLENGAVIIGAATTGGSVLVLRLSHSSAQHVAMIDSIKFSSEIYSSPVIKVSNCPISPIDNLYQISIFIGTRNDKLVQILSSKVIK
jgi:hypothetical protein